MEKYKPDVYKKIKDAEDSFDDISFSENSGSGSMSSYEKLAKNVDRDFFNSTKIKQLMALLDETREKNPYEKTIGILLYYFANNTFFWVIVFSSFVTFLDLLETPLHVRGMYPLRYDGRMTKDERQEGK